jgi:hypothetical protein
MTLSARLTILSDSPDKTSPGISFPEVSEERMKCAAEFFLHPPEILGVPRGAVRHSPNIRNFTNDRGSGLDGPSRDAKPAERRHTQELSHKRAAAPHTLDILQPPLEALR